MSDGNQIIITNNLFRDPTSINQELDSKPPEANSGGSSTLAEQLQQDYFRRANEQLNASASILRELQIKIPGIETEITSLKNSLSKIHETIDARIITKLDDKKFSTKEEVTASEARLVKQIDEIKSNKKMYLALIVAAVLGFLANAGLVFIKQKYEKPTAPLSNPQNIEQPAAKITK